MINIYTEFRKSQFEFDRIVTDNFSLPYSLSDVEMQPNELAVSSTINLKLEKLYTNMLYLYGLCNIASFNIPKKFTGWIGTSGRNTAVNFYNTDFSVASSFYTNTQYRNINNSYIAESFAAKNQNNLIVANKANLTLFSIKADNTPTFVATQSLIDPLSGSLYFQNIAGISIGNNKNLYVLDKNLNNLYLYDLETAFGDDYAFSGKLFLQDVIGGLGDRYDLLKFNSPNNIVYTGSEIIVEDTGNKAFKVYDKNLNFLSLTVALTLFGTVTGGFNSLTYDTRNSQIIGTTNSSLYFLDYRSNYNIVSSYSYSFANILNSNEIIKDVKFASYDLNIVYILTNQRILKKWLYKLESNIGVYDYRAIGNRSFEWFTTTTSTPSADQICLYCTDSQLRVPLLLPSNTQGSNIIALLEDELNLISLFKDYDFNIYDLNDIKIKPDEYVQSWVFNKSLKKLAYNMFYMTKSIAYRFYEGLDDANTPVFLRRGYNDFFLTTALEDINTFSTVCVNENFQSSVLNRCFANIHSYQNSLMRNIISNKSVLEVFVPSFGGGGGGSDFNYITYSVGAELTLIPNPTTPMLYGGNTLFNLVGDMSIGGTAPYDVGAGISITEVT